jgi:protoporphyrinogen oxidase
MKRKKLIILGAGISGLVAGEILSRYFNVQILEKEGYIGGLASNFEHDSRQIPRYYHHIIKSNNYTQEYLKKFMDVKQLNWKKIKVSIGVDGKISMINSPFGLLNFQYLNFYEKIRFGLFGIYSLYLMNPSKIPEEMDVESWLNNLAGKAVTQKIFYNLYGRNKFNIPLKDISAKQFANRLHEKEIQDFFSFPKEGYQKMIDNLGNRIRENNGKIEVNSKITKIDLVKKQLIKNGKKIKYDLLLSTIPFEIFLKISRGLPKDYSNKLSKIKYCPCVGLCFGTKELLHPKSYWINLFGERIHIIMQHSLLNNSYKEKINWCLRYGGSEEDLNLPEKEIKDKYLGVIKKYFPKAEIIWAKVFRTKYAEPIYDINYHKYMPKYKSPVKGLYFAGIQLTHPKIRNINVAIKSGIDASDTILKDKGIIISS